MLATVVGDSVRYLSPLRKLPAGEWRGFAAEGEELAARAGTVVPESGGRFRDYAGEPVLAATRPIDGTGWNLVVKVDVREALAGYRANLRIVEANRRG